MSHNSPPRLVVTALKGGAGKTVIALGLTRALRLRGLKIIPFKKGPDYLDAGWLSLASGGPCFNLDPFLMSRRVIRRSFLFRAIEADFSILEGNRGLFDGVDVEGSCSTAELAKSIEAPVVLVLDCTKMTRTSAALVLGCRNLDPDLKLAGVILNQVATSRHETIVRRSIEKYTDVPVIGALPRMKEDPLPMRHLGVTPCDEHPRAEKALQGLSKLIENHVDVNSLVKTAGLAGPCSFAGAPETGSSLFPQGDPACSGLRVGVVRDAAFHFYYPENLEALEAAGAELVFLDALKDRELPDIDALYIGGGFPETLAPALSANRSMRENLRRAVKQGLPVYAECGGLMYLGKNIIWKGEKYPMVGTLGWNFVLKKRPVGHGYSILRVTGPNPYYEKGSIIRGHEFHYSQPVLSDEACSGELSCVVERGHGFDGRHDGIVIGNVFATYTHLHALSRPDWALRVLRLAAGYHKKRPEKTHPLP